MEKKPLKWKRTSPTLHLLLLGVIFLLAGAGYFAIIWSGDLRGYEASKLVAGRSLCLLLLVFVIFFWLTRKQRFRGEMMILTAAVFLFAVGGLMQFRLFADPEYGARGKEKTLERREKAQAIRLYNIKTAYDDEKKAFMFGKADAVPKEPVGQPEEKPRSLFSVLLSTETFNPLVGMLALVIGFLIFKDDAWLLWLQKHTVLVGIATSAVMFVLVLLYSFFGKDGKLFGQTPWEGMKILFLLSFAGILADTYRRLRQTRWGVPPFRYLIPFALIAIMPVISFFLLKDFGQLLVFFGVYVMLYIIAVRNQAKLFYAIVLLLGVFLTFAVGSKITTGSSIPRYMQLRFHAWTDMWNPPSTDVAWWRSYINDYVETLKKNKKPVPDLNDPEELQKVSREVWKDKTLQYSQGLFGINNGKVVGEGLGLGYPETVPVSDSDYIYAAIGEELGMVGSLAVLLALAVIVFAGTTISIGAPDMFTKLLAAGLTSFVAFQAIVNIGGVLRVLPMTGITLPFVSHGGWSLITSFAMLGILLAISHRNALSYQAGQPQKTQKEAESLPEFLPVR
jgi:cell division protein FtsW (lipid II flippase)